MKSHEQFVFSYVLSLICFVFRLLFAPNYAMEGFLPVEKSCVFPFRQEKTSQKESMRFSGSPNWTRTSDTLINSQVLYRLSYGGIFFRRSSVGCRLELWRNAFMERIPERYLG